MALNIQVLSDNRLFPTVFNVVQGSNKVDTVVYTMENHIVGEKDLSTHDWYVHLIGVDGVDAVKLTSAIVDGKLQITFDLTEYVTRLGNTLTYQLVAKDDKSAVWNSAKGVILNAESINADDKIVAEYPSILRQWELRLQEMAGSLDTAIYYIAYNETLPKEKRVAGRLYFKYLYAENKNGQLEDSNGNILIPEAVAKNIGITAIDGLTAGTVQEALQALKVLIENKDSLPAQTNNAGKYLRTNGQNAEWAEVEALPEQGGHEGKFLKSVGGKAEWADAPRGLPLLALVWSDHKFNDVSYLRADNFTWHSGDIYVAAYEHLFDELGAKFLWQDKSANNYFTTQPQPEVGDIIYVEDGGSVYVESGLTVASYNKANNTITLNNGVVCEKSATLLPGGKSRTDTIGDITIRYYLADDGHKICWSDQEAKIMALYEQTGAANYYLLDAENKQFKLPRKSKPVGAKYEYYYVGNYVRNQTEINIGEIAERVNEKVDVDASNLSVEGKSFITNLCMPDYAAPVIVSNPFTCPTDGYLKVFWNGNYTLKIDGVQQAAYEVGSGTAIGGHVFVPLKKGSVVESTIASKFYPCIGAK